MAQIEKYTSDLDFAAELFKATDKLRSHLQPSECKHVVLGLIFLKYISDAFDAKRAKLEREDPGLVEKLDEYLAENVFWIPPKAHWSYLQDNAKHTEIELSNGEKGDIGQLIDQAMEAIENVSGSESIKGALPKNYGHLTLDKRVLEELIDLLSSIPMYDSQAKGFLGNIYEYFLAAFASSDGKRGGEFFTPRSVIRILVEMLGPLEGPVYDPCCGSGGMFVETHKFIDRQGKQGGAAAVYGQEINHTAWQLAKMNLAIQEIEAAISWNEKGSLHQDEFPELKADFILTAPPFNLSDWGGDQLQNDARWIFGPPPTDNANFAWLQHIYHHLSPKGMAGVVLANSSISSEKSREKSIRKAMIKADIIDAIVTLPGQLFYSTQIPVCIWILAKDKASDRYRNRQGEILLIDARDLGNMVNRVRREINQKEITKIADTYHRWRDPRDQETYKNIPGFCKSVSLEEVEYYDFVLNPARYIQSDEINKARSEMMESLRKFEMIFNEINRRPEMIIQFREKPNLMEGLRELQESLEKLRRDESKDDLHKNQPLLISQILKVQTKLEEVFQNADVDNTATAKQEQINK